MNDLKNFTSRFGQAEDKRLDDEVLEMSRSASEHKILKSKTQLEKKKEVGS